MQQILIVGATSRIAEHCARLWVQQPCRLVWRPAIRPA